MRVDRERIRRDRTITCVPERLQVPLRGINVKVGVDVLEAALASIEEQRLLDIDRCDERRLKIFDLDPRTADRAGWVEVE